MIYKNGEFVEIPALIENIIDSTGAGDAFLAITSPLAYTNTPLDIIGVIGNIAGAVTCSYQGNKESINKEKICDYLKEIL